MSRKRILVNALSVKEGGAHSYLINLTREIARDDRGFDFTLLAPARGLEEIEWHGARVETLALPERARGRLATRVLYEHLVLPVRARRFDLLYCVADMCPIWGSTPTVVLMRNLNIYDRRYYGDARTRTLARLVRLGAPQAAFAVFPSHAAAARISRDVPIRPGRAVVVHYGIDPAAFDPGEPAIESEQPYLFLAAAPERHKGIDTLIAALPHLPPPRPELWIAGDSSLDPEYLRRLQELARDHGVAERVRFIGRVPYAELLGYYRRAKAMVFPSRLESFGHPLLEAMLAGTPIVASDIPTFRELAEGVAVFFPTGDAVALAAAVGRLEQEPDATAERVELGRRRAAEFSWKRSIDQLCAVFERALAKPAAEES